MVTEDYDKEKDGEISIPDEIKPHVYIRILEDKKVTDPNFDDVYNPIEGNTCLPYFGSDLPEDVWNKVKEKLKK